MALKELHTLLYSLDEGVAIVTLNRPEKLNAFSDELVRALAARLRQFDIDEDAHLAIITGSGRAFSTGADVHQRQLRSREEFERLVCDLKVGGILLFERDVARDGAPRAQSLANSRG